MFRGKPQNIHTSPVHQPLPSNSKLPPKQSRTNPRLLFLYPPTKALKTWQSLPISRVHEAFRDWRMSGVDIDCMGKLCVTCSRWPFWLLKKSPAAQLMSQSRRIYGNKKKSKPFPKKPTETNKKNIEFGCGTLPGFQWPPELLPFLVGNQEEIAFISHCYVGATVTDPEGSRYVETSISSSIALEQVISRV